VKPLIAYSSGQAVGSWGWRHSLAWQQLSALWGLRVQQNFSEDLSDLPLSACAFAFAIAPDEFDNLTGLENYLTAAPVVFFLNRVSLQVNKHVNADVQDDLTPPGLHQHVFIVNMESPLTSGLPGRLVTFGPLVDITPLSAETDLQILVWLDEIPIIGYRAPHLLVGADAWQLGNPSVPLIYPILLNWLRSVAGCDLRIPEPYAAIRLDDLPVTAYELLFREPARKIDRRRAATLRRLRNFSLRSGICLSLMYTSHYYSLDGNPLPVGNAMPLSIRELCLGIEQKVFEIGAHGMLHLRFDHAAALKDADAREFLDLDDEATNKHLRACAEEIQHLFDVHPTSFVAPAWGYRPGLTKKIAGQQFKVVIDSSQHMEDGSVAVFSVPDEESPAFNCTETFRPGSRMLSFTSPEFWKCYALAGIPVHYMQHTDTNWHLIRDFLDEQLRLADLKPDSLSARLVVYVHNAGKPRLIRIVYSACLAVIILSSNPTSGRQLWKLLTSSSLYVIIKALQSAGYQCVEMNQLCRFVSKSQKIVQ